MSAVCATAVSVVTFQNKPTQRRRRRLRPMSIFNPGINIARSKTRANKKKKKKQEITDIVKCR